MRAYEFLRENSNNQFVHKHIPWVAEQLGISDLPKINLINQPVDTSFGGYNPDTQSINLVTAGRHPVDVLRTLAHELTHYRQDTEGKLTPGAGETGTPQENEANSEAGVVMRDFAQANPEYFGLHENAEVKKNFDDVLIKLCDMIMDGQQSKYDFGKVAACVIDPDGNQVFGINSPSKDKRRFHAERVAIDRYLSQFSELPKGSTLVTTLSPCNRDMDDRYGKSCSDLIAPYEFAQVHCGYKDPSQDDDDSIETNNAKLKELCKKIADTFLKEDTEPVMIGKIEATGKIVRIIRKQHSVLFSPDKDWLLVDVDPALGDRGLGIKWIPANTRFSWVRPYRSTVDENFLDEGLRVDVPNEEWLQDAIDYAKQKSPDRNGLPYMGKTTATVRSVDVPVDILKRIPGMRREQQNVRQADLAAIIKIMSDTGKLPLGGHTGEEYKPFINVAYDGSAWINEGNHRIMAAAKLGWKTLPVEISYFDGGERVESGAMYPPKIGLGQVAENFVLDSAVPKSSAMNDFLGKFNYRIWSESGDLIMTIQKNKYMFTTAGVFYSGPKGNQSIKWGERPDWFTHRGEISFDKSWRMGVWPAIPDSRELWTALDQGKINTKEALTNFDQLVKKAAAQAMSAQQNVKENFADGKGPGKPGDSQRHGIHKHATMAELEKASHASGRKGQLARWQINMRNGHKK